jgi:hypothetical protein
MALRRASAFGVARLSELAATAVDQGIHVSEAQAREALAALTRAEFLDDDWFWLRGGPNRLAALARRILAVSSPLEIRAIRAGVCRTYAQPQAALVPPAGVMEAFFGVHPRFLVDARHRVGTDDPLDYRRELGKTDQVFVEVLRSSWTGVLDQAAFRTACTDRGMRPLTFNVHTAHSAVLDHPAADVWCLTGTRVSPIIAAALRHAKAALNT